MTSLNNGGESPTRAMPMPRWKRVANNATVIVSLIAVGFGNSIFIVVPAALIILWFIRRDHRPRIRSTPRSRLGHALDSGAVQATGFVVFVGIGFVQFGVLYALASALLCAACGLFARRFF